MTIDQQIQYIQDRLGRTTEKSANAEYLKAILKSLKGIKDGKENEKSQAN